MSENYKKQLNNIVVSDQLKQRILAAAEEKIEKKASKSKIPYKYCFRIAAGAAACAAIVFVSAITVNFGNNTADNGNRPQNIFAQMPKTEINEESDEKTATPPENKNQTLNTPDTLPEKYNIENRDSSNSDSIVRKSEEVEALPADESAPSDTHVPSDNEIPAVLAPAPAVNIASIEEIESKVGYKINLPQYLPDGYAAKDASLMFGSLVQIVYSDENDEIIYRTEKTQGNISGDYNVYDKTETAEINGVQATFCGNDDKYYLAYWNCGEAYSLSSREGLAIDEFIAIAESVE